MELLGRLMGLEPTTKGITILDSTDKMTLHEALNIGKTRITIMLDDSIIQSYKTMAGGRGYQTLINETLRRGLEIENIKNALREVLREDKCPN